MAMVSTQPAPPNSQPQEQEDTTVPIPSLPLEADPSGFTERAPALLSLLPDEALTLALSRGDGFAVHAALAARLARESSGAARDTLRELLGNRALFVMAERPPQLSHFLGTGVSLVGLPAPEQQQTPFIATRAVCVLGVPVWPLGEHLVQRGRDGRLEVLGRAVAASGSTNTWRWLGVLGLAGAGLAAVGLGLAPFVVREVQLANGLSRPVEVRLDDRTVTLKPGELVRQQVYSLGSPYHVEARWPGAQEPFEALSLESSQRAVYNVLGAASLGVGNPAEELLPAPLEGRTASLESDERVDWQGDWESKFRGYAKMGRSRDAANLAKAVFLADPSELKVGEDAARMLARSQPREALGFAADLQRRFPEDPALNRLAQELFIALDKREEAFAQYNAWAQKDPGSVQRALWAARVAPLNEQRALYAQLRERFPASPE
ncbi:MAG: tetratricopeptide repeat protein, partial [Hyalangium sp.]|uniref:tetratricopeptide repeat protein n=1 Tax=Hyalangium sp. TaxID=2028555 RepID=UPI0038998842